MWGFFCLFVSWFLSLNISFQSSMHVLVCYSFYYQIISHCIDTWNFISLSVDGHLGGFHSLAFVNSVPMNIHAQDFEWSILLGIYSGMEFLGHMVTEL